MVDIIKLGSLYVDNTPAKCGMKYKGGVLSIGDTVPGKELPFVKVNNLLVGGRTFCTNISWLDLDVLSFIRGKEIWIDGQPYLCRSLKVGNQEDVLNEWDSILDIVGEDNAIWHWSEAFFWGQEKAKAKASTRAVRGYHSARSWHNNYATHRNAHIGFRPALEVLTTDILDPDSMVDQTILVNGPGGSITGTLREFTDYDLFLEPAPGTKVSSKWGWCCRTGKQKIIIDRSTVIVKKEDRDV